MNAFATKLLFTPRRTADGLGVFPQRPLAPTEATAKGGTRGGSERVSSVASAPGSQWVETWTARWTCLDDFEGLRQGNERLTTSGHDCANLVPDRASHPAKLPGRGSNGKRVARRVNDDPRDFAKNTLRSWRFSEARERSGATREVDLTGAGEAFGRVQKASVVRWSGTSWEAFGRVLATSDGLTPQTRCRTRPGGVPGRRQSLHSHGTNRRCSHTERNADILLQSNLLLRRRET